MATATSCATQLLILNGLGDMKVWQEVGRVLHYWSNGKVGLLYKRRGELGTTRRVNR